MIAVTGATGEVGRRVIARLAEAGAPHRSIVRDASRAAGEFRVASDYGARDEMAAAFSGADTVFLVPAAENADRVEQHKTAVDAALAAGVPRLVYLSFFGAAPDATFTLARDHWATEQHIRLSGLEWTFLRDNLYADFLPFMVGEDGVIRGPAADGRAAVVAQDDIADAAIAVLRDPGPHAGQTYDLTGPEALTLAEAAGIVGRATGREVRYHPETLEEAYASRKRYEAPDWQVDAWVSTYTAIAAGELATVSGDVALLTGHEATALGDLLRRTG